MRLQWYFYSHTPHGVQLKYGGTQYHGKNFYSHTPHGVQQTTDRNKPFLLTHPSRGATWRTQAMEMERRISTHTPLTGCNKMAGRPRIEISHFYSHTPHGVQLAPNLRDEAYINFYSHTPHGVQRISVGQAVCIVKFLLTHPSRGAT